MAVSKSNERLIQKCKMPVSPAHLGNIIILLHKPSKHIDHPRKVWTSLHDGGTTLHLKKCELFKNRIDYLDNVICPGGLKRSIRAFDAIHRLQF